VLQLLREHFCTIASSNKNIRRAATVLVVGVGIYIFRKKLGRLWTVHNLFKKHVIVHNFRTIHDLGFDSVNVSTRGTPVATLQEGKQHDLPPTFTWQDMKFDTEKWLEDHWTTGLVVLKRDSDTQARVLIEKYFRGNDARSRCISWSMCKSVVSALFGIAVDKQLIRDIANKTVTDYVPELIGSGYEGVPIKHVLQMSSGIAFDEDYFHPLSDINMMGYTLALGWSMDSFVASLKAAWKPGVRNHYVSMDTQVLAMILTRATRQRLSDFAEENLWSKVGFQSDATWLLDNEADRTELAFGILGATTRDWARFGWLYLNGGVSPSLGTRILSEDWVRASLAADAPHLQPGKQNSMSDYPTFGYGYQWWLCPHPDDPARLARDYMALGVYGQLIYVSPDDGLVIAKNAAFPHYAKLQDPESHENYLETQGLAAMRAIARSLRNA